MVSLWKSQEIDHQIHGFATRSSRPMHASQRRIDARPCRSAISHIQVNATLGRYDADSWTQSSVTPCGQTQ